MLTRPPTPEDIIHWRQTAARYRSSLKPNRKSADEVVAYIESRYPFHYSEDPKMHDVVAKNVLLNAFFAEKLPHGARPSTRVLLIDNEGQGAALYDEQDDFFRDSPIIVGIEACTRHILVEGSSKLFDELTAFVGLDIKDIENDFLVAQYIESLQRVTNGTDIIL
ncbi:MAG: hypothetical protein GXY06_04695 [Clostridiaceae bacterium]|nr:hypothetical protein [Clostridiaceae bacterium]